MRRVSKFSFPIDKMILKMLLFPLHCKITLLSEKGPPFRLQPAITSIILTSRGHLNKNRQIRTRCLAATLNRRGDHHDLSRYKNALALLAHNKNLTNMTHHAKRLMILHEYLMVPILSFLSSSDLTLQFR